MRGTFANIRLRNLLGGGRRAAGGRRDALICRRRRRAPEARRADVDLRRRDALHRRKASTLVVLAGKEYGSGSSRDWAAKGTKLLGVRAVIARELRAHPPLEPGRHGRAAAAVPRRRERAARWGSPARSCSRSTGLAEAMADGGAPPREVQRAAPSATGARAGRVRGARAHRHAARGRVLPPRGHPPVRPATAPRRMSDSAAAPRRRRGGADGVPQRAARPARRARALRLRDGARRRSGATAASAFAEVSTDVVGTPLARVSRQARLESRRRRLLVMGHIDEIGLIVTHIDDEGYLWFRAVGGWDAQILVGQRVVLDTRDGPVDGRRRQEADPPAARGGPQEGRRDPRPAHRHRRARRRRRRASACGSATSP